MIQAGFGIFRMFERGEGCLLHHHRIYKVEQKMGGENVWGYHSYNIRRG